MPVELYFILILMVLIMIGSTYLIIDTRRKWERYYDWLDRLQDKWKWRSPGDKRPVFPSLIFTNWLMKRAPWMKTFAIWWIRIFSFIFFLMALFFVYLIVFGIWFPGRLPLPFP